MVGSTLVRSWLGRGFNACFMLSGSVGGEVPLDKLEPHRLAVQEAVMSLMRQSEQVFEEVRA